MMFFEESKQAAQVVKQGGIILYPTDTIWGLGCDATNVDALKKLFKLKKRDPDKPVILLLENESMLESYVTDVPETAWSLIEYTERPLTIIYDGSRNLPLENVAADGTVAIRITRDDFCSDLIRKIRKPLVSTSANISGEKSPEFFDEISDEIKNGVDYIVNYRQNDKTKNSPSQIIRLKSNGEIKFIRK